MDSEKLYAAGEKAEVLFTRLMLVSDDFGRFDGRVSVIGRRCWPLGGPTDEDISKRLDSLAAQGLVYPYKVDGKPFISIPNFRQRLRRMISKYPEPPSDVRHLADGCQQFAGNGRPEVEVEVEVEVNQKPLKRTDSTPPIPRTAAHSLERTKQVLREAEQAKATAAPMPDSLKARAR